MKRTGLAAVLCLAVFPGACGGESSGGGSGGTSSDASAGSSGSAGKTASGGTAGSAGSAGADGGVGTGGTSGSAGSGGGAGSAGTGGSAGSSGEPPSCAPGGDGLTNCGPNADESCCASPLVPGGTFYQNYDGVTFTSQQSPATLSAFRLDKYAITVGRFRGFVAAWVGGWRPAAGAGKHSQLNAGNGLATDSGGYEPGWDPSWDGNIAAALGNFNSNLQCNPTYQSWTASPGANERRPVNCANWYELYAFCIWDGGFLPTEVERNFAASGGDEQRVYPWSTPPSSSTIDCTYANYLSGTVCEGKVAEVGSRSPKGDGRFGHADLAGNLWDWVLDWYWAGDVVPCTDCVYLTPTAGRAILGGSFNTGAQNLLSAYRASEVSPALRPFDFGARCARAP